MIARTCLAAALALAAACVWAQTTTDPEPAEGWFNMADASADVTLTSTVDCPGCRTLDEFRNAFITHCFSGYRVAAFHIFDLWYWGPTPETTPGAAPGPNGTHHVAGPGDHCRYNVELRGNLRGTGAVHGWVCNDQGRCLLVRHQFVPRCPGVGARIAAGRLSVNIVNGCLLLATGIEGMCTTVRDEDLNEDDRCITIISDRGQIPGPLPEMPNDATPPPPPPPDPNVHGNPGHNDWLHTINCTNAGHDLLQ